jgi:hypothetical protein
VNEPALEIEVLRYRPEADQEPTFQTYTVPYQDDWVVLDALNHIKDNLDRTLSYRWSCHMAICGSCGMMINGEPKLSCHAFLRDYYPGKVRVEPLTNFPIERDLVIVMDDFLGKLESVKPYVIAAEDGAAGAAGGLQAVRHVHQLPALLRRLSPICAQPGLRRTRGASAGPPLQPGFPRRRPRGAPGRGRQRPGGVGLHLRGCLLGGLSQER